MSLWNHEIVYEVLGGATYKRNERRVWNNYDSLPVLHYGDDLPFERAYSLDEFPEIEDFEVQLVAIHDSDEDTYPLGYSLQFSSTSRGQIASFLGSHIEYDICEDDFTFPLEYEDSYSDLDQGWILKLEYHEGYIYIMEGDFDRVHEDGYHTWCKVPEQVYIEQWEHTIQLCRELY